MWVLLECLCFLVTYTNGAKILGIFMTPSHSHQIMFQPVWKELSLRGHQVTVYTPAPLNDKSLTNLTEYDLSFSFKLKKELSNFEADNSDGSAMNIVNTFKQVSDAQLDHPSMQDLIKNAKNETYDLLLVEYFWQPYYTFKDIYKVPMIGLMSMPMTIKTADAMGIEKHPVVDPDLLLSFSRAKTFKERVQAWTMNWMFRLFYKLKIEPIYNDQIMKYFGKREKGGSKLMNEISLLIGNFNFALDIPKPKYANFIPVNSLHVQPPKPLPKDLARYMDNLNTDAIYFSLGTNVHISKLSKDALNMINKVLGALPYTVLWKYDQDELPENTPKNFYVKDWFPQQDLLAHPKVKLFITQGGLQSIDEALSRKVPMLMVPIFGDQPGNADRCVNKKIAEQINIRDFTEEELRTKLNLLLNNTIYRDNIEKQAAIANDQPMSSLDTAIFWIEYVIRHKGAPHLRSPVLDLPFYQYYLLDIYMFVISVLVVAFFVIPLIIFFIFRKIFSRSIKQKTL